MKKIKIPDTPTPSEEPATEEQPAQKSKDYLEVRIPRLSFKNSNLNVYLVFVLVVFAFLLGMLANKVMYLEKQLKNTQANAAGTNTNTAPAVDPNATPTPLPKVDIDTGKLPVQGDANAKVTLVEFSDFQCPFCKKYFDETNQQLMDTYVKTGKVKFAYRHYPLSSIHPNAQKAAEAAECANDQGKFWEYHDLLFKNQDTWSPLDATAVVDSFTSYAGDLGLDTGTFRSCLDSETDKTKVDTDTAEGNRIGVSGTPTFVINGNVIVGAVPFSELQKTIEQELNK
jgi:protein-disulfide isomerase